MEYSDILFDALRTCVGLTAAAYALAGLGLNLQFGFTGLLNLGYAGSMMMGAYGTAIAVDRGASLGVGVIVGILAAVVMGVILGLFTLKLRHEYLAIVTIAFAEILRFIIRSRWADPFTKSVFGIQRFADAFYDINPIPTGRYGIGSFVFTERNLWLMLIAWPTVALVAYLLHKMITSPWGRVLKAVREDEEVARSLGKNVFLYKLQSLTLGGSIGAMAGILLAIDQQNVHPNFFIPTITFYVYCAVILGGTSKVWGPILGAVAFWFLFTLLTGFTSLIIDKAWLGNLLQSEDGGALRFVFVGLGLMLLLLFRPEGLAGKKLGVTANG